MQLICLKHITKLVHIDELVFMLVHYVVEHLNNWG